MRTLIRVSFGPESFEFLEGLESCNSRDYVEARRAVLRDNLQKPFAALLEEAGDRLTVAGLSLSGGERTMFRLNRDTRFSNDKSPYKTQVGGLLTRTGTKAESGSLVYVQLSTDGGMVAAGLYQPATQVLNEIRDRMLDDPDAWQAMVGRLSAAGHHLDRESATKSMPRGYAEHKDHRLADDLRLKQYLVHDALDREEWIEGTVADHVVEFVSAVAPLLRYVDAT